MYNKQFDSREVQSGHIDLDMEVETYRHIDRIGATPQEE